MNADPNRRTNLHVEAVSAFTDNYIWIIHDERHAVVVDPGDASPVLRFLEERGLELRALLLTHHHADHIGGADELLRLAHVPVYGPPDPRIPQVTQPCREGDHVTIDAPRLSLDVLETPGHTRSHIVFYNDDSLFCGDTLFSVGCGRLFEGTPEQMRTSLSKFDRLRDRTRVFCAHEYTESNCAFAMLVEPGNADLEDYFSRVQQLRTQNSSTLPSTLGRERACNPFLRTRVPEVVETACRREPDCDGSPDAVFGVLRRWKDQF